MAKSRCRSGHPNRGDDIVLLDAVHDIHALAHLAEDRVHSIEVRLWCVADEELASTGVLARMRHAERPGHVLMRVEVRLALDLVARPAGTDPGIVGVLRERVAALDHEVVDDAVKPGAVVELAV